ncbi:MAG: SIMPL domain-containing protein [Bacillota bacterium]
MKRGLFAALLAGLMLIGALVYPAATYAETQTQTPPPRTLNVTGHGKIELKPDTATIILGISQVRKSPAEAYAAMSADLVNISGSVKTMGVKEEEIKTGTFNLQAEYNWTQEKGQELVGYRATTTLNITTQQLDKVAELIQQAVEAGANQLNGIQFYVKNTDALVEQALDMAVDDARAKADRVAGRLGAKVVRVLSISIQDNGVPTFTRSMSDGGYAGEAAKAMGAPAPVFGGTTTFTSTVYVTFEIQ